MKFISRLLCGIALISVALPGTMAAQANNSATAKLNLKVYRAYKTPNAEAVAAAKAQIGQDSVIGSGPKLPLWLYGVESARDGNFYSGVIVGKDPFSGGGRADIRTFIVPVIIKTHTIVTGIDNKTGSYITKKGTTVFDPTAPDFCLGTSNNVALTLLQQSPIFKGANFNFGGTPVGVTQYTDAFQRSNFWNALGSEASDYHVLLNPVNTVVPIVIDVPAAHGTAVPASMVGGCASQGVVDLFWLDNVLVTAELPALTSMGVNPGTFPFFEYKNVVQSIGTPADNNCCVLGYHSGAGLPIQTYGVGDFDTTGAFPTALQDTGVISHEVAEWMNDPFVDNFTPAWGNTGQVAGCQGNLEVGDPLTGTNAPSIYMPNGFTYHLQELAEFSWFFGGPSVSLHHWFSNNATFLHDAGPVCQVPASSTAGWRFIPVN